MTRCMCGQRCIIASAARMASAVWLQDWIDGRQASAVHASFSHAIFAGPHPSRHLRSRVPVGTCIIE